MKILHVLRDLSRNGGVQRLIADLALEARDQHDIKLDILILYQENEAEYTQELRESGITVHKISAWKILMIRQLFKHYDIVHTHLFPALYLGGLLHKNGFYTEHNTTNNRRSKWWSRPLEALIYRRYRAITCISPAVQQALLKFLKWQQPKTTCVIYNGVNLKRIRKASLQTNRQDKTIHIAMTGSLTVKKDQATLIRALALLPEHYHLHLAGEGPERQNLEQLVKTLRLQHRVKMPGVITDVVSFLADKQLYVQSSHWEGFGLAAIEAMACGKLTLCSDVPGLNDLSDSDIHLFTTGDTAALANLIERSQNDSTFAKQLQKLADKTATQYSIETLSQQLLALYHNALSDRTTVPS